MLGGNASRSLHDFRPGRIPVGIVVAAVFGLTPGRYWQRVQALGDLLKLDIEAGEPSSGTEQSEAEAGVAGARTRVSPRLVPADRAVASE
jgi:hypothetical protein